MKFLRDNWSFLIIVALVAVIFLQRCQKPTVITKQNTTDTVVRVDTVFIKGEVLTKEIVKTKTIRDTVQVIENLPSKNYDSLLLQFVDARDKYLETNIYHQKSRLDSFGTIDVIDSISQNTVIGRSITYQLKIPTSSNTITNTIYPTPKNKWFLGGAIEGNKSNFINQFELNMLLLNKKDKLFQIGTGMDIHGLVNYRVGTYWKL